MWCPAVALSLLLLQRVGPQHRKVFVGGLPSTASDDSLKGFFCQFGDIEEAVVIHDKQTRLPRG